jgi:hypothetical protein
MRIHVVDALKAQRDLLEVPRGMERFDAYVRTMIGPDNAIELPLFLFNPMAREHVAAVLDDLIAFAAESIARDAATDATERLDGDGEIAVIALVIDDARGGWTNRYITDFEVRFTGFSGAPAWAQAVVWSSEGSDPDRFRRAVLSTIARSAHIAEHGYPTTLREMLVQEGRAAAFARGSERELPPDDLAYTLEIIEPHLDTNERPTQMACLYGDEAAREVGYEPLGLSSWAGLAAAASFVGAGA